MSGLQGRSRAAPQAQSNECPGPGALLGVCQAAAGQSGVGEIIPAARGGQRIGQRESQRRHRGAACLGRAEGEGRCGAGSCQELLKGYPFDVREVLGYSS